MNEDKKFVEDVLKAIVLNPSDVRVERSIDEMGVLLTVFLNPKDMGLVIGKEGSTVKAIRILARMVGIKNKSKVNLKIFDPKSSSDVIGSYEEAKSYF